MASALGILLGFVSAFATTFIVVPWLIPKLKARGIVGNDLNKQGAPEVAEMGGLAVVVGFFVGASVLLAWDGIGKEGDLLSASLNASLVAILGAAFVGMIDDVFDLRQRQKAFLPFVLALPLGATISQSVYIPFVGLWNFEFWMIPVAALAVTCAANAANMLEGFNGLGTGLGIIMAATLTILCFVHKRYDALYVLIPLMGTLLAFLWFNKYPAKIFPGDTMMLFMGAAIATAGLLSNLQVQTTFIFIPMIVEFALKTRGHFKAENYASKERSGYLEYHGRIESITHLFMRRYFLTEKTLVEIIWFLEAIVCAVVIAVDLVA